MTTESSQAAPTVCAETRTTPSEQSPASAAYLGALVHLSGVLTLFMGPLLVYVLRDSRRDFLARAACEALNFQLTLLLAWILTFIALFFVVGFFVIPVLALFSIGMPVWAAAMTSRGDRYCYPVSLRLIGRGG